MNFFEKKDFEPKNYPHDAAYQIQSDDAAILANAKIRNTGKRIYGRGDDWGMDVASGWPTQQGLLICIENIKTVDCKITGHIPLDEHEFSRESKCQNCGNVIRRYWRTD